MVSANRIGLYLDPPPAAAESPAARPYDPTPGGGLHVVRVVLPGGDYEEVGAADSDSRVAAEAKAVGVHQMLALSWSDPLRGLLPGWCRRLRKDLRRAGVDPRDCRVTACAPVPAGADGDHGYAEVFTVGGRADA